MIYRPLTSMDVDDATAIEMIPNARNRLAFARRNDMSTPDVAYAHLIEALDSMLDLSSEDFSILDRHARAFQARVLVKFREQVEQQCAAGLSEWEIPKFVQNNGVDVHQAIRELSGFAGGLLGLELVHKLNSGKEPNSFPVALYCFNTDGRREVRLSCPRTADEQSRSGSPAPPAAGGQVDGLLAGRRLSRPPSPSVMGCCRGQR